MINQQGSTWVHHQKDQRDLEWQSHIPYLYCVYSMCCWGISGLTLWGWSEKPWPVNVPIFPALLNRFFPLQFLHLLNSGKGTDSQNWNDFLPFRWRNCLFPNVFIPSVKGMRPHLSMCDNISQSILSCSTSTRCHRSNQEHPELCFYQLHGLG